MTRFEGPERRQPTPGVDTAVRNYPLLLHRYQRLLEVTRNLSSTLELPSLLHMIVDAAVELTETEAASILLLDATGGQLRFEATTHADPANLDHIQVPIDGSIAGTIFTTGQTLIIADVANDPRHFRGVDLQTTFVTRSILGVPLVSQDKPIGVLQALNKKGRDQFVQEDVDILEALAAQAATAIINARLFQQSDLIAEIVHELRTPLAALMATSYLLLHPELPGDQHAELVRTIQSETGRLTSMTTEFLDLAKLESGRARFVWQSFDLAALAGECAGLVRQQAGEARVTLRVDMPPDLPSVHGDRGKLKQVLLNLLTNAVKYNREGGGVHLSAAGAGDRVRVEVRDTGRGIPPDALKHIFEKFYRVPDSEGYSKGTGLGLAIAKRIVEAHGASLEVESQIHLGTSFSFAVPVSPDQPGGARPPAEAPR